MRNLLSLAIVLALPGVASASGSDCLVSFAGAQHDVCSGEATRAAAVLDNLLSLGAVKDSTLRLVKFDGPITPPQRAAVEAAGATILDYAPYYAYIVRMPAHLDAAMRGIHGVVWSGPLMPALKVDPNIYNELKNGGIVDGLGIDMIDVALDTQAAPAAVRGSIAAIAGLGSVQVLDSGGETRVRASFARAQLAAAVEQLALREDVLAVGFHKPMRALNSQGHWLHQSNVNSPAPLYSIWNKGLYGCGQIIGELDTGLWMDNIAFADASQPPPIDVCTTGASCPPIASPNLNARKVIAYYKWSGLSGSSWDDNHGHGTHVAGSIFGNDNGINPGTDCSNTPAPSGTSNLVGMAPYAKLVMQESGGNLAYLNTMGGTAYHAADTAYQNGARIHSNSWGGGCTDQFGACISGCTVPYDEFARDADRVMRDRDDLLVVFAAGNDATACPNGNNVGSPGNAKNVLTIGASNRGTGANAMASFSSRGPTLDSRTKPDLDAQGSSIVSASRTTSGTTSMSGTSMATPTAAGNAALVRDYLARGFYPSGTANPADAIPDPSGALVKAIMAAGAFKMTGSGAGANPGQAQGFGRILLDDSLYFSGDAGKLFIHDEDTGLQTGDVASFQLNASGGQRFTVVLTWSDAAGAINASPATVNSLRLEVQAPNGDVWTQKLPAGYNVNNANPTQSTATSNYDAINTLQRIQFDAPAAGAYEIRVRGINVPSGPQKFALAATGISNGPDFALSATPNTLAICAGSNADYSIGVRSLYGLTDAVTLGTGPLPGASTAGFSVNPVTPTDPAATSLLSIGNTASLARGSYTIAVNGATTGGTPISHGISVALQVSVGIPVDPALNAPTDGATGTPRSPTFSWASDPAAEGYTIEVASDSAFTTIVASGSPATNSWMPSTPLAPLTTYYWRVRANSVCGNSAYSATFSFTTGVTFPEPYCPVTFPNNVEPITKVIFTGINNASSAVLNGSPALEDFLGVAGGLVQAGQSYPIAVEGNTDGAWTNVVNAFIDWNRDGSFGSGEAYPIGNITNSTGLDGKQATNTIAVPAGVTPGPVRMRVLKRYSSAATACNSTGYGQGEDYTLIVQGSASYTVGGAVTGLVGSGLVLSLNGGAQTLPVSANGSFTFPTALGDGSSYAVTVATQPGSPAQTCTVSNGSGTLAGANVTNVAVACTTNSYTVGGAVTGLVGSGLVLSLNGSQSLPVSANGSFTFPTALGDGSSYAVTVATQPGSPAQTCMVSNGSGTLAGANVTNVAVACTTNSYTVGGSVTGLAGSGLVLSLNGGAQTLPVGANGSFTFPTALGDGSSYAVTVATQPGSPAQTCMVSNGSGILAGANVTNVAVACTTNSYTVGGSVTGLVGSGLVLSLNGSQSLPVSANGSFTFPTALPDGSSYAVTVATQPTAPDEVCTVGNGSGTLAGADVTNVTVSCIDRIFADGFDDD